jgi:glutamine amidotransferase
MCRLFAQHASPAHDLQEPLCVAHNALRTQSHRHVHGWGIGWYDPSGAVQVRRGVMPAHADDAFVEAARAARSEIVLAHVRDASVGDVAEANTHPFVHGRWLFAHNGTVARFKKVAAVRAEIEAEIDPDLRALVHGDTDSERCFHVFLTRLRRRPRGQQPTLEDVRAALCDTVQTVAHIADPQAEKPSSMNLLVTDGRVLAVCRRGRTLHVAPHHATSGVFAIASEPIGPGPWREVPEDAFAGIDAEHRIVVSALRPRPRPRRANVAA